MEKYPIHRLQESLILKDARGAGIMVQQVGCLPCTQST